MLDPTNLLLTRTFPALVEDELVLGALEIAEETTPEELTLAELLDVAKGAALELDSFTLREELAITLLDAAPEIALEELALILLNAAAEAALEELALTLLDAAAETALEEPTLAVLLGSTTLLLTIRFPALIEEELALALLDAAAEIALEELA